MDENLINKVINGNEEQFRKLFDELSPDLFRIAKVRLRENEDINDAIQNTMIITYQSIIKKKKINNLKAWIIKVLINECNKIYNLNQKHVSIYERLKEKTNYYYESNENLDFENIIENLKYKDKLLITLYYGNRYTCEEISKILKMNNNTVKSKILRIREKIKKELGKGGNKYE